MNFFVIILTVFCVSHSVLSIPILNNDDSIVISDIELPTDSPSLVIVDQEISLEPESSFHDLIEKYDETFMKNLSDNVNVQKRSSSSDDDEEIDAEVGGKSIIEKIHISDPDVRKEFEIELSPNQVSKETTDSAEITDYEPNYASKTIAVQEKETLQVHLVEQLVHQSDNDSSATTIIPDESFARHEIVTNPEIVEVLEHIVYESDDELKAHEHTTVNSVIDVKIDIDPIEIIPKDRHRLSRDDENDKFAGFDGIPVNDLTQPDDETTEPDNFFKKTSEDAVETIRETLEYVAIYGKSLNVEPTTLAPSFEITVNSEKSSSSEEDSSKSISNKSSEEKVKKCKYSSESSEENSGKENFDDGDAPFDIAIKQKAIAIDDFKESYNEGKILNSKDERVITDDYFRELNEVEHEIKKKDHPDGFTDRSIDENSFTTTVTALYETLEDITTTISDGIKLTNELRNNIESFRDDSEENKIVLDTLREAISSKNSKIPLVDVNDSEMMTLKDQMTMADKAEISIAVIPIVGCVSIAILIGLFKIIKGKASSVAFY